MMALLNLNWHINLIIYFALFCSCVTNVFSLSKCDILSCTLYILTCVCRLTNVFALCLNFGFVFFEFVLLRTSYCLLSLSLAKSRLIPFCWICFYPKIAFFIKTWPSMAPFEGCTCFSQPFNLLFFLFKAYYNFAFVDLAFNPFSLLLQNAIIDWSLISSLRFRSYPLPSKFYFNVFSTWFRIYNILFINLDLLSISFVFIIVAFKIFFSDP